MCSPKRACAILADIAIPTLIARPCPKGPPVASTPDNNPYSGCPAVFESICLKFFKSSKLISGYPVKYKSAYCIALACAFDITNLSLLYHFGLFGLNRKNFVHKTVAISAIPIGAPGCPELARSTISIAKKRTAFAIF